MDTKNSISSIIGYVILLIIAVAVGYFLDKPVFDAWQSQVSAVANKEAEKQAIIDYNTKISETDQTLKSLNWDAKKRKIEANFFSSPFFQSELEIFFSDLVKRNGMILSAIAFSSPSSVKQSADTSSTTEGGPKMNQPGKETPAPSQVSVQADAALSAIESNKLKRTTVTLTANGTYEKFKNLLKTFEHQGYIISVKKISFKGGSAVTDYFITADIYSY
jgi:hypothetical protein